MSFVDLGIPSFVDPIKGKPVFNGYIYVGIPDTDPELFPKTISLRQQDGVEVPTIQPVRTGAGGVPLYNNSPVQIIVDGDYSLKVKDAQGNQVYYIPSALELTGLASVTQSRQEYTALAGQTLFVLTGGMSYTPGTNNLAVFVDGCRQESVSYVETSSTSFTFNEGLNLDQKVLAITNGIATSATSAVVRSGSTASRPSTTLVGYPFFDTTLGKPIWWNGASWRLADGTAA